MSNYRMGPARKHRWVYRLCLPAWGGLEHDIHELHRLEDDQHFVDGELIDLDSRICAVEAIGARRHVCADGIERSVLEPLEPGGEVALIPGRHLIARLLEDGAIIEIEEAAAPGLPGGEEEG